MENKKRDIWSNEITDKEIKRKQKKEQIIYNIYRFLFDIKQ